MDRIYRMALRTAEVDEEQKKKLLRLLDRERYEKARASRNRKVFLQRIGIGLLLQKAAYDYGYCTSMGLIDRDEMQTCQGRDSFKGVSLENVELSDFLHHIQKPCELTYSYTEKGKPSLADGGFCFSASHSDEYVLLAVSHSEIGADIQKVKPEAQVAVARRFFSDTEVADIDRQCPLEQGRLAARFWCMKEAYGKLLGIGLTKEILATDIRNQKADFIMLHSDEEYEIAVCIEGEG